MLTGIHLSSYGIDFPENEKEDLLGLMTRLDKIQELKRMRLGSLEPRIITEDFAKALSNLRTICPHFHLSLQSGCNQILKKMNRHYSTEEYEEACHILRTWFPNPAITTDVIVGFPQETEEEFEETLTFAKKIQFYEMHIFKYSKRAGTKAAIMEGQIEDAVKSLRSERLLQAEAKMSLEYRRSFLGQRCEILMEEKIRINGIEYLVGHSKEYVKAAILWDEKKKGKIIVGILERMLTDEVVLLTEIL